MADDGVGAGLASPAAVQAVLFDVDFTLAKPGPLLGGPGYREAAARYGLSLEPERYAEARQAALLDLQRHPELDHDEEIWVRFTEDILRGMGAEGPNVREIALEITRAWERSENFELYEDVLPTLAELRRHGLRIALVSNTSRDLDAFVRHFSLDVDAWVSSGSHGKVKPSPTIFRAALELVETEPERAAMVGDSPDDDVEGAAALGMRAFLLDRETRFPDRGDVLPDLRALPAALGLVASRA
ncbi:MAG: HAD family hydrolase [Actinomycetota bacterium]|nr:HAD family hydrolase [Actinomycetota bacterium]